MDEEDRPEYEENSNTETEPVEEDTSETVTEDTIDDRSGNATDDVHNDVNSRVDEAGRRSEKSDFHGVDSVQEAADGIDRTGNEGPVRDEGSVRDERSVRDEGSMRVESNDTLIEGSVDEGNSLYYRFRHDNDGALMWLREMLSSIAIVLVLGLILFAVSGVWPPMVAVESGSMEPNMGVGDLVLVTEPGRFAPDAATNDIGVVTHEEGMATEYQTFGSYGSVVIFQPPGRIGSPIIHRAMFHVEEGEDWHNRADEQYHNAADCSELEHCPAPHDGFITLGDNNGEYDQANGLAAPVKAEWVTGVARLRVPYLGYIRLIATGQEEIGDLLMMSIEIDRHHAIDPVVQNPTRESHWVSNGIETDGTDGLRGSSA